MSRNHGGNFKLVFDFYEAANSGTKQGMCNCILKNCSTLVKQLDHEDLGPRSGMAAEAIFVLKFEQFPNAGTSCGLAVFYLASM